MAWWEDVVAEEPAFAARVKALFLARKHSTLATLRRDGSPRISATEVDFGGGGLWLNSMPNALKALDLRRDPRFALHCPTEDTPDENPGSWPGDAKLAGRAHEVGTASGVGSGAGDAHRFRLELTEVVLTRVAESGDHLVIETWHP